MRMHESFEAYFDGFDRINVYKSNNLFGGQSSFYHLKDSREHIIPLELSSRSELPNGYVHSVLTPKEPINVGEEYYVYDEHCQKTPAVYSHITKTRQFAEMFNYGGSNLGLTYTPEASIFRLWAPTAFRIILIMHDEEKTIYHEMRRKEHGLFETTVPGDCHGMRYSFMVRVNGQWKHTTDPYSFFSGPNGKYNLVQDRARLDLPDKVPMEPLESNTDAVIYEANIRDMTSQLGIGVTHPRTFEAFTEENEITQARQTGFSYLKTLGITHVQLMPVFDFGSVDECNPEIYYNWGYDPAHHRVLEGSYSTDPDNAALRVQEFAQLVHNLHKAGLRVNLDLVFNHVYNKQEYPLENIVPYYYFLMNANGEFSNGSFCGNDIDTRPTMSRKYWIDTCRKIVEIFDVDGFRFDLMGILDVNLMNEIAAECRRIKPGFMVYGEGWNMPSFVPEDLRASQQNQGKMPWVGHFSDRFREVIRGSSGDLGAKGFASGNLGCLNEVMQVMAASCNDYRFDSPEKVVNYIECHDNHTLWDKNRVALHGTDRALRHKVQILANAAVLLSQGIPFLHSGQEFARTKGNEGNTYNKPDSINHIDYFRRDRNSKVVRDTRTLIDIRKQHKAFRLRTAQEIHDNVRFEVINGQCLLYRTRKDEDSLAVFFNPAGTYVQYTMEADGNVLFDNGDSNQNDSRNLIIAPWSLVIWQFDAA